MGAFAIVARHENLAFWDDDVDFAGGVGFGPVVVRNAGGFIWVKPVGEFVVEDGENAIFDLDALASEGDDALDDVLVLNAWSGFAGKDVARTAIGENDDLAAFGCVFLTEEVRNGDGEAINDNAIVGLEGVFHARADDVVAAEDEGV